VIPPLMGCKWGCERFFDLSRLFSLTRARVRVRAKEVRPVHWPTATWHSLHPATDTRHRALLLRSKLLIDVHMGGISNILPHFLGR
jgi:hypothetical protein